jgi:hypothetical protein
MMHSMTAELHIMRNTSSIAVLFGALLLMPGPLAHAQLLGPGEMMVRGSAPVTFKVAVKLASLMPDVAHVRVHCVLQQGSVPIAHGETTSQVSSSGHFDSVVTVPVNILYPNQTEAKVSMATQYNCSLQLLNNSNPPQVWAPDKANVPVWAQPKTGTPFAKRISGTFPPKQ